MFIIGSVLSFAVPVIIHAAEPAATQALNSQDRENEVSRVFSAGNLTSAAQLLANVPGGSMISISAHNYIGLLDAANKTRAADFDEAIRNFKILQESHHDADALNYFVTAYQAAPDQVAFRRESWVQNSIRSFAALGAEAETRRQWLSCLRIYSGLAAIEPVEPGWKRKLLAAMQATRLLRVYAPKEFALLQSADAAGSREAERLLLANPQPAAPTTDAPPIVEGPVVDWHEVYSGVTARMVDQSLLDVQSAYYRQVSGRDLLSGGLTEIKMLLNTDGIEESFPSLADTRRRRDFESRLDAQIADISQLPLGYSAETAQKISERLSVLAKANDESIRLPEEVLIGEFADGITSRLDPYSSFIWPSTAAEVSRKVDMGGIGIQIETNDAGEISIVAPLQDGPAAAAGLRMGDVIVAVDGNRLKGFPPADVTKRLSGPVGTTISLQVRNKVGATTSYSLVRRHIKVTAIAGWKLSAGGNWDYMIDANELIGYIRLVSFTNTAPTEFKQAADKLREQHARAIILDLRYCPGGILASVQEIAATFVKEGVIYTARSDRSDSSVPPEAAVARGDSVIDLPLIVLVDEYTAAGAELLAACLEDRGRARILGDRTFGSARVQMLFPLDERKAFLKLTTLLDYSPSGRCVNRELGSTGWGVMPDIRVPASPKQMRTALSAAMPLRVIDDASSARPDLSANAISADIQLAAALFAMRVELNGYSSAK
jgi:carboxyl-terminal processing protease